MSTLPARIDEIYYAINSLDQAAERISYLGGVDNYDRAKELRRVAREAMLQYNAISAALPRLRALESAASREYDSYVTRNREPESCTCFLSAPCSFCTSEVVEGMPA